MNPDQKRQLGEIKSTALGIQDAVRNLSKEQTGVKTDYQDTMGAQGTGQFQGAVNDAMTDFTQNMGSFGDRKKTIMETFADRRKLAQEGGQAQRELIGREAGENIESTLAENVRQYTQAQEGRAGFGTKTAAVRFLEDTGAKRITDLEKQRDNALLQSKVLEAERLDNLISKEQEAITNARTSWINDLLSFGREQREIAQEERTARSFETPEQIRTRDLQYQQDLGLQEAEIAVQQAESEAVREMAITAPEAGITSSDTYDEAVAKYRNSDTYKRNERAAELELEKVEAGIANTRSLAANRGVTGGSGSPGITVDAPSNDPELNQTRTEMNRVASNVLNLIPSENGKEAFLTSYNNATTDAQRIDAISSAVLANSPAEVKSDFRNQADGIRQLDEAIALIDQGVQTGVLNAANQYIYNIAGKDFDPDLAAIDAYITAAIQPYRSSITGAAWGRQETAEYEDLFGDTSYSPTELRDRLVRMKAILNNKSINAITSQVSPFGTTTFDLFSQNIDGSNSQSTSPTGNNMFGGIDDL